MAVENSLLAAGLGCQSRRAPTHLLRLLSSSSAEYVLSSGFLVPPGALNSRQIGVSQAPNQRGTSPSFPQKHHPLTLQIFPPCIFPSQHSSSQIHSQCHRQAVRHSVGCSRSRGSCRSLPCSARQNPHLSWCSSVSPAAASSKQNLDAHHPAALPAPAAAQRAHKSAEPCSPYSNCCAAAPRPAVVIWHRLTVPEVGCQGWLSGSTGTAHSLERPAPKAEGPSTEFSPGGTFSFGCGTLPKNALCLSNPTTMLVAAGASGTVTMQITTGSSGSSARVADPIGGTGLPLTCGLFALPLALVWRRRRVMTWLVLLVLAAAGLTSCTSSGGVLTGGSGGTSSSGATPAGTYTIPVTATANGVTHTLTVTLTVD